MNCLDGVCRGDSIWRGGGAAGRAALRRCERCYFEARWKKRRRVVLRPNYGRQPTKNANALHVASRHEARASVFNKSYVIKRSEEVEVEITQGEFLEHQIPSIRA